MPVPNGMLYVFTVMIIANSIQVKAIVFVQIFSS